MDDFSKLIGAIDAAESNSYGSGSDGDLANDRAAAIDYYLGRNVEPAPDGRSQVVDRAVYETIQWMLPSLSRIFASGDDVVQLPPVGPEDEQAAEQEGQYLNYVVMQKNNWFDLFNTAAKDALLNKAGYLYPYKEKVRQVEVEKYERQRQEGVALIMQDKPEIVSFKEYPDPEGEPTPVIDPQTQQPVMGPDGQPQMQPPAMLYDLEIRRTREEVKYCILSLPPERCKISKNTKEVQLRDCDYFEYWDIQSISQLRQDGYEIEDDIAGDENSDSPEDDSRDQYGQTDWSDSRADASMRQVKVRWIWIRYDADEDGIAEMQYCVRVGSKILYREECNRIPVAVLCADPLPHRHIGLCPADTVIDIQRVKTVILRQGLDNLYLSNNPRTFASTNINLDDLLVSRPGGVVRGKQGAIFGQDIAPLAVPFVFPQAMEGLEYMDQVRENRTGTNRYFTGIDQNALNKTATGVQQLTTMAAQRVEQIARHFANGIEELFSILHEVILKSGHQNEVVKLRGKWVPVNPAEWRRRTDFKISVGYAAGNKDAMVNRLMLIAQMQEKALAGGLPIANAQNAYETAIELTKASDFATPERFWTDPATAPPPGPPQPDVTIMAAEQLKADTSLKTKGAELETEKATTSAKLDLEKYKADLASQTQLQIKGIELAHQQEMKTKEMEHAGDLEDQRAFNEYQMADVHTEKDGVLKDLIEEKKMLKLKEFKGLLEQQQATQDALGQIMEVLSGIAQEQQRQGQIINGQRRVVRGKDGKAAGVEVVSPEGEVIAAQRVHRGQDGKILGSA